MKSSVLCLWLAAFALTACSAGPSGKDVAAQAQSDGRIAFDLVKIDDAVLTTLLAQPPPAFHERFKRYLPPPELKIAVGDTVSVVIWESAANGLFGTSLTEWSVPSGAGTRLIGSPEGRRQGQDLAASPGPLGLLLGGAAAQGGLSALGGTAAQGLTGLAEQTLTLSTSLSASSLNVPPTSSATIPPAGTATSPAARAAPGQGTKDRKSVV